MTIPIKVIPHQMFVVAEKTGHVLPFHHVQEYPDPVRSAVDHIAQYVQVIFVTKLHFFQHLTVQVVHSMYVAAYINTHV